MNNLLEEIKAIHERRADIIYKIEIDEDDDYSGDTFPDFFGTISDDDIMSEDSVEVKTKNLPLENWRKFVEENVMEKDEQLFRIAVDGNCEFSSISIIKYGVEDPNRIRKEIVQYMLKISFGDMYENIEFKQFYDKFQKIFEQDPALIKINDFPKLIPGNILEDVFSIIVTDFVPDSLNNVDMNIKVMYIIIHYMEGLPDITNIPFWGDNILIPFVASQLYKINLCIIQINYDKGNFVIENNDCDLHYGDEKNKTVYELILYNKGLNNHFDLIVKK